MMKPRLSVVAVSRNDNHGDDMLTRMILFVDGLIQQSNRYHFPIELIIVEWNPLANQPLLHEVLPQPRKEDMLYLRYIIVPHKIHARYRRGDLIPLYQMIGKNVGIRRAKSDFVLCTNVDLLFSDPLFEKLSSGALKEDTFYRSNRVDVKAGLQIAWSWEDKMAFCKKNTLRRLGKSRDHLYMIDFPAWIYQFQTLSKVVNHFIKWKKKASVEKWKLALNTLDFEACGDFTLMHRNAWEAFRGYPEFDLYSIHIDSFGLILAKAHGFNQFIFPNEAVTYHMYHNSGWESMNAVEKINFLTHKPGMSADVIWELGEYLFKEKKTVYFNPPNWGLIEEELAEYVFP